MKEKLKCEKTILNKVAGEKLFSFKGSRHFLDAARESQLKDKMRENPFLSKKLNPLKAENFLKREGRNLGIRAKAVKLMKTARDSDPLKPDQEFLRKLETNLQPVKGFEKEW